MALTTTQVENIQIDYGIVYINFGVAGEKRLAPTRGGGEFTVKKTLRDIVFDGAKGKGKGAQVIDDMNAMLKITLLDTSMDNLALAMPFATYSSSILTCKTTNQGVLPTSAYLTNVTMFAKTAGGNYKKITLYNAMAENDFTLAAKPNAEGEIVMEISAHWDITSDSADLFKIEDVASIGNDVTKPTVTPTPADGATGYSVSANLTALFSEDIRQQDITSDNFLLVKASDGSVVAGALTYNSATKTATLDPDSSLTALTPYIWTISRVRDLAGNTMLPVVVNFTTA